MSHHADEETGENRPNKEGVDQLKMFPHSMDNNQKFCWPRKRPFLASLTGWMNKLERKDTKLGKNYL